MFDSAFKTVLWTLLIQVRSKFLSQYSGSQQLSFFLVDYNQLISAFLVDQKSKYYIIFVTIFFLVNITWLEQV